MSVTDTSFAGSIPSLYDRYLGPALFQPYAQEVARRASELDPRRVLEIAAGTGIVTEALHRGLLEAEIVATDLNPAMLDLAAQRISSDRVTFQPADALDLPFEDGTFGLVVCQFGLMFFPDKVKGNAEARRVLRKGGNYLLAIWDTVERNGGSEAISDAVAALFPDDPPRFIDRTPFGYADCALIERDLRAAAFEKITIETVEKRCRAPSARDLAIGMCCGSPLRNEIEGRDPAMLDRAIDTAAAALGRWEGPDGFDAPMSAHIVTASK